MVEPGLTFNPGVILGGTDVALDEANAKGTAAGKTNVVEGGHARQPEAARTVFAGEPGCRPGHGGRSAPTSRGAGDIQFVAPLIDSLDGLGASGSAAHSPDERVDLTSLERSAIRAALPMYRLTR